MEKLLYTKGDLRERFDREAAARVMYTTMNQKGSEVYLTCS